MAVEPTGTGNCYEVALDVVMAKSDDWFLVHGTVVGNGGDVKGVRYGHAWVMSNGMVFDLSNGRTLVVPWLEYKRLAQARIEQSYTASVARKLALEFEHFGPWHEETE